MEEDDDVIWDKLRRYAARTGRTIVDDDLGSGIDGIVVVVAGSVQPEVSVLKAHFEQEAYVRERDAYRYRERMRMQYP